ncbi:MAG TPA: tryptophan halogenase family protein [Steroidobacteraceae bacterium]|nr:tryptophan halogenase family protein [Steroidobacteraceae bacterium]
MTATLFNRTAAESRRTPQKGPGPPPGLRRILVVGGGSAGWMTALILARALAAYGIAITLIESPAVGTIGVGEGSTPWLRGFFDSLNIEEAEWMPACHATYKCGISFANWSTKKGFERYFHPFASMLDNLTMTQFVRNVDARVNGADVYAHPDRFFIAARLAGGRRAPKPAMHFPFDIWHGYHFDAVLLGQFLQRKALERGVRHRSLHVTHANLDAQGAIESLGTREGETLAADLFVDCSGFSALLIGEALQTPFISFAENLFNDAAVAMPTPVEKSVPSETVSTAMKYGWAWRIPLTDRFGNGYVYSTQFCSPDAAERELREHLGLLNADTPARHLKMKIGRMAEHWRKNCLAVGLSQGFIEPLEATALLFIQQTAETFVEVITQGDCSDSAHQRFNARVNEHFEGTRDYIVTHYKTNSRADTDYWRENATNLRLSDPLKQLLSLWMSGKGIAPAVREQALGKGYPVFSWYALMAGMGIFPDAAELRAPRGEEGAFRLAEIDDLLDRSAANYPDHAATLQCIPPRRNGESLQVYFW